MDFRTRFTRTRPYPGDGGNAIDSPRYGEELERQLERDRARVVNCDAIRRLQHGEGGACLASGRTGHRGLSRALEAKQAGRFIVRTLYAKLPDSAASHHLGGLARALESVVEIACLAKNIGQPPFGQAAEEVLRDWFAAQLPRLAPWHHGTASPDALPRRLMADLCRFDSGAQTLRMLTKLLHLNLTYTQTAALMSAAPVAEAGTDERRLGPSAYYLSELSYVDDAQAALALAPERHHPAVYLVEAAETIARGIADLEEAVARGILDIPSLVVALKGAYAARHHASGDAEIEAVINARVFCRHGVRRRWSFGGMLDWPLDRYRREPLSSPDKFFTYFRVGIVQVLVNCAAESFITNLDAIHGGDHGHSLVDDNGPCAALLGALEDVALQCARQDDVARIQTLAAKRAMQRVLDAFVPLLVLTRDDFAAVLAGRFEGPEASSLRRRRELLGAWELSAYDNALVKCAHSQSIADWEFYYRCRLIQDIVSGMTEAQVLDAGRVCGSDGERPGRRGEVR